MAVENVTNVTTNYQTNNTNYTANNILVNKAEALGINVGDYYTYDEEGNCTGIDTQKLNMAIKEAQLPKSNNDSESDSFVRTCESETPEKEDEENDMKADSAKDTIDSDYKDAISEYQDFVNSFANNAATKEGQLADEWNSIETDKNKLTGITASDTTILEGVKEFITGLTNLVNDTKNYENSQESKGENDNNTSFINNMDFFNVHDAEAGRNTLGNNPFFASAFETSDYEEETAV